MIQRDFNKGEALPGRLTMIWNLKEDEKRLKDEDLDLPPKLTDFIQLDHPWRTWTTI